MFSHHITSTKFKDEHSNHYQICYLDYKLCSCTGNIHVHKLISKAYDAILRDLLSCMHSYFDFTTDFCMYLDVHVC